MFTKPASVMLGSSSRLALALALAIVFLGATSAALAQQYEFLDVMATGPDTSQFMSDCGMGFIDVTHVHSAGGAGPNDNNNALIFPSAFPTAVPGTGNQVPGHLAQTLYGHTSVVTFHLSNYQLKPSTLFGMWNTTDEAVQPPYRIELLVNNVAVAPILFNQFGTGDNTGAAGVNGRRQMQLNPLTGDISAGAVINGGNGIHTNALFWNMIPALTTEIRVYGNLSPIPGNTAGDGVGYYFAEICIPEPTSFALSALGLFSLGMFGSRRKR